MQNKSLNTEQVNQLLSILKNRFEKNMHRHSKIVWEKLEAKLRDKNSATKLNSLNEMEISEGEPDVIEYDSKTDEYIFFDCSAESPKGRRSLCYDRQAWESRKEHKPQNNIMDIADEMGVEVLSEQEYRFLQQFGEFDLKTSSWIKTPDEIRKLGGALFCDRRYNQVFVYHNGAESYYEARGFRASLRV